jgi:hypothetical protein
MCSSSETWHIHGFFTVFSQSSVSSLCFASEGHLWEQSLARGGTPLHEAADKGHGEICRVLLAAGAQVDARDDSGLSALKRWTHGAWGRFQVANKIEIKM